MQARYIFCFNTNPKKLKNTQVTTGRDTNNNNNNNKHNDTNNNNNNNKAWSRRSRRGLLRSALCSSRAEGARSPRLSLCVRVITFSALHNYYIICISYGFLYSYVYYLSLPYAALDDGLLARDPAVGRLRSSGSLNGEYGFSGDCGRCLLFARAQQIAFRSTEIRMTLKISMHVCSRRFHLEGDEGPESSFCKTATRKLGSRLLYHVIIC